MLAELAHLVDTIETNPYFGGQHLGRLRVLLSKPVNEKTSRLRYKYLCDAGKAELRMGNVEASIDMFTQALAMVPGEPGKGNVPALLELAVSWLRMGENQNCCSLNTPDSCLLPIRGSGVHRVQEGSRMASGLLLKVLELTEAEESVHLSALWLLNIAAMTLGEHPDGVPEKYRIPPERFESKEEIPRFMNVAPDLGLDDFGLAGGVVLEDFDGDGLIDIMVSGYHPAEQMKLYGNRGDGKFEDRTHAAGLIGFLGGLNMIHADYDNDGDSDVLVLRGAWWGAGGHHPNSLLRNDGGKFRDVTFESGLGLVHNPTQTGAWADYDNDGDLDLFIGNESRREGPCPSQLFENRGDGTFVDVAARAGLDIQVFAKGVAWGDYDHDRFPDLYVTTYTSSNLLFHNEGDGTFIEVGEQLGVSGPKTSFPTWFWDFDNDGHLDLFASCYTGTSDNVSAHYLGRDRHPEVAGFYRGDGQGGFESIAESIGLDIPMLPMGANYGDINGDGFLDMYLGTGDPDASTLVPNLMFLNKGGKLFSDVTESGGFGNLQKGHALAFADFDNDGDMDVFEEIGGGYLGDEYFNALFENPGFGTRWLKVELEGVQSNRCAIGARIHLRAKENGKERSIYRTISSGGSFGANPLRQTIGLGKSSEILRLEVFWPTTGKTQVLTGIELDSSILVVEGADSYVELDLPVLYLGE